VTRNLALGASIALLTWFAVSTSASAQPVALTPAQALVSRSRGVEGGVVLLWPRVIPRSDTVAMRPQAATLQRRLRTIIAETLPGRPVDVRPEPERVCTQSGCLGSRVGVLLIHRGGGCAAVALVGTPGRSMTRLVPWAGDIGLKSRQIRFRDYPESSVIVDDLVPCGELLRHIDEREPEVRRAIHDLGRAMARAASRPSSR